MNYFDKQGNPITVNQWTELHNPDYKRIGLDKFEGRIEVSTVWMGINHQFGSGPPLIFETMIFGPDEYPYADAQTRYTTERQATDGHRRVCDDIEHGRRPWFLTDDDD